MRSRLLRKRGRLWLRPGEAMSANCSKRRSSCRDPHRVGERFGDYVLIEAGQCVRSTRGAKADRSSSRPTDSSPAPVQPARRLLRLPADW
jgi:hypothetical protein